MWVFAKPCLQEPILVPELQGRRGDLGVAPMCPLKPRSQQQIEAVHHRELERAGPCTGGQDGLEVPLPSVGPAQYEAAGSVGGVFGLMRSLEKMSYCHVPCRPLPRPPSIRGLTQPFSGFGG